MLKIEGGMSLTAAVLAVAVMVPATSHGATRPAADEINHLTPWVLDVVKIDAGMDPEMDWRRPDAPNIEDIRGQQAQRSTLSGPEETMESENFVLHFTREGDDAVTDEQVNAAFDSIELVWDIEVNGMGYPAPPDDGVRGGDRRYDFYFTAQRFTYGVTYGEDWQDSNSMSSYIELATWMDTLEIQVTVAHEFFHALHFTMDAREETWWYEVTATWMEDIVYDDINDYYNYVPSTLAEPGTALTDTGNMYANAIWGHSLTEAYGNDIIQEIWFLSAESDEQDALANNRAILEDEYGASYNQVLHNWRESFVDQARFSEGDAYPDTTPTAIVDSFPVDDVTGSIVGTGSAIIQIPGNGGSPSTLSVGVIDSTSIRASLLLRREDGQFQEWNGDSADGEAVTWSVDDFGGTYTEAYVVLTNVADSTSDDFAVHVEVPGWDNGSSGGCNTNSGSGPFSLASLALAALFLRRRRR